jgi:hypothetical protein
MTKTYLAYQDKDLVEANDELDAWLLDNKKPISIWEKQS